MSGKTAEFQFRPTTTASDVAKHIFENWPEGKLAFGSGFDSFHFILDWQNEPRVDRFEVLRLIYQGRFLHGNVTLGALRLQQGQLFVLVR